MKFPETGTTESKLGWAIIAGVMMVSAGVFLILAVADFSDAAVLDRMLNVLGPLLEEFLRENEQAVVDCGARCAVRDFA